MPLNIVKKESPFGKNIRKLHGKHVLDPWLLVLAGQFTPQFKRETRELLPP